MPKDVTPEDPTAGEANPHAISVRIEHRSMTRAKAQRDHDLRRGVQPRYVQAELSQYNDTLIEPQTPSELRQTCEERRSLRVTRRAMKVDAAVATCGIITFGKQASRLVGSHDRHTHARLFRAVAEALAERLNTTLTGLVVHRDETAIHAHFQLPAYNRAGTPLSKATRPAILSELQDVAARAAQTVFPEIERGTRYGDRLAAGATFADVVHRSVAELHQDLPRELEAARKAVARDVEVAKQARASASASEAQAYAARKDAHDAKTEAHRIKDTLAELQASLQAAEEQLATNEAREGKARAKAEREEARAERAAKDAKTAATYARRASKARAEVERLTAELEAAAKRLTEADRAQATAQTAQAAAETAALAARRNAEASTKEAQVRLEAAAQREVELASREAALVARARKAKADDARVTQTLEYVETGVTNLDVAVRLAQAGTHDDEIRPVDMASEPAQFAALKAAAPEGGPTWGFRLRFWSLHFTNGDPLPLPEAVRSALARAFDRVAAWAADLRAQAAKLAQARADLVREAAALSAREVALTAREAEGRAEQVALEARLAPLRSAVAALDGWHADKARVEADKALAAWWDMTPTERVTAMREQRRAAYHEGASPEDLEHMDAELAQLTAEAGTIVRVTEVDHDTGRIAGEDLRTGHEVRARIVLTEAERVEHYPSSREHTPQGLGAAARRALLDVRERLGRVVVGSVVYLAALKLLPVSRERIVAFTAPCDPPRLDPRTAPLPPESASLLDLPRPVQNQVRRAIRATEPKGRSEPSSL
jgi:predicted  nucleic acid-binding Zn-ribbon protein